MALTCHVVNEYGGAITFPVLHRSNTARYKRKKKQFPARQCVTQLNLWPHCSSLFSAVLLNVKLKLLTSLFTSPWLSCFNLYLKTFWSSAYRKWLHHLHGSRTTQAHWAEIGWGVLWLLSITFELHRLRVTEFMFSQLGVTWALFTEFKWILPCSILMNSERNTALSFRVS